MSEEPVRILVVDDESAIRRFLRASLTMHGYAVFEAASGTEALQEVRVARPDVIILDIGLPGIDGVEVTRYLREWNSAPIIILSVRDDESGKVEALDAGADDYLTKPFGTSELLARIRAALRRANKAESGPVFAVGELSVDLSERSVRIGGHDVQLTATEWDLLKELVLHAGKVLTHRQLVSAVWGNSCYEDAPHLLRVNISNLRRKLCLDPSRPRYIVTEPGVGYRLLAETTASAGA
jgi:two-component system KDP operon response regulator KdpE